MVRGYVFVRAEVFRAIDVVRAVKAYPSVLLAETVSGPYDVIVQLEAPSTDDLRTIVTEEIGKIPGVVRAILSPVTSHERLWEELLEPAYTGR